MNTPTVHVACLGLVAAGGLLLAGAATAADPEWNIIKPSNTGVPGEEVRFATFAPDGRLWVAARWPFWGEGGIGIYDFDTRRWDTYANWETPIPSPWVNDIEYADDGSAWIATEGGLVHWAGDGWTVYTTANAPFVHNRINDIDLDQDGHVWINNSGVQTTDAQILEFDGASWRTFKVGAELPWDPPWDQLSSVLVDSQGHVWVANKVLNGIAEYDGATWTLHGEDVNRMSRLREDLDGNLWMIAGTGGGNAFYRFDGEAFTLFFSGNTPFVNTTVTTLAVDDAGDVWVANWFGQVIRWNGQSWTLWNEIGIRVHSINVRPNGDVWLTSAGAARHYDANGTWLEAFNTYNTGLPDYFIEQFLCDSRGDMWFSSGEAGASRRFEDGARWTNWGSHNPNHEWPFLADGAEGLFEDDAGDIWIGSNGVGRIDIEEDALEIWDWRNSNLGVVWTVTGGQDANGDVWIGTDYSGAYRFDGTSWLHKNFPPGGTANEVEDMVVDAAGNLWVSTFVELHRFDGVTWTTWNSENSPLSGSLRSVAAHPDGSIWIGTRTGVVRLDGDESWTRWDEDNSNLPADEIQEIDIRDDGLVGVAAYTFEHPQRGGVSVFDGKEWTTWTTSNSPLTHFQVVTVGFDADGHLWASPISEGVVQILIGGGDPADIDGDGVVGFADLLLLLAAWGPCDGECPADLDGNGIVEFTDLLLLLSNWS